MGIAKMINNDCFNLSRCSRMVMNEVVLNRKIIIIVAVALAILCIILPFGIMQNFFLYNVMLYGGGLLITGSIFNELHEPMRATAYLMLPCSTLERLLSKWVLSSIGYALGLLVAYYGLSWTSLFLSITISNHPFTPLNIFQTSLWLSIGNYILLQSIFFLGATYFKKFSLIKTTVVIGLVYLGYIIYSSILLHDMCLRETWIWLKAHGLYSIVLSLIAVTCWAATYLKITEQELK